MLDFNVTENDNSIEELFCKRFDELSRYPMNNETSQIFVKMMRSKNSDFVIQEADKSFIYKVIEIRISHIHTFEVDDRVLLFLSFLCKSAGECVMYIWYMQYQSKLKGVKIITFEIFTDIFACGFPSSEALQKIWKSQKVDTSNKDRSNFSDDLLDYTKAGKSLF
jgi:hypothetical protein